MCLTIVVLKRYESYLHVGHRLTVCYHGLQNGILKTHGQIILILEQYFFSFDMPCSWCYLGRG